MTDRTVVWVARDPDGEGGYSSGGTSACVRFLGKAKAGCRMRQSSGRITWGACEPTTSPTSSPGRSGPTT